MRYMLLVYSDEHALSDVEREHCYVESAQLARDLSVSGNYVSAGPLHPTATATSVRVRNGKRLVTDGPFAETREQLGGYYLIEAPNLDAAMIIAERIPVAKIGTIEIRPLVEISGLPSGEAQVRAIIEDWGEGLRNKDADRCASHYTDDVVQFDLAPPLQYQGKETLRNNLAEWFKSFDGPIGFEVSELKITAASDVAFARCLNHITGKRSNGENTDLWVRVTLGFQNTDGKWLVNHEHVSVPFYMDGSFRAAVDLKP